jgi:hypothetical protein
MRYPNLYIPADFARIDVSVIAYITNVSGLKLWQGLRLQLVTFQTKQNTRLTSIIISRTSRTPFSTPIKPQITIRVSHQMDWSSILGAIRSDICRGIHVSTPVVLVSAPPTLKAPDSPTKTEPATDSTATAAVEAAPAPTDKEGAAMQTEHAEAKTESDSDVKVEIDSAVAAAVSDKADTAIAQSATDGATEAAGEAAKTVDQPDSAAQSQNQNQEQQAQDQTQELVASAALEPPRFTYLTPPPQTGSGLYHNIPSKPVKFNVSTNCKPLTRVFVTDSNFLNIYVNRPV